MSLGPSMMLIRQTSFVLTLLGYMQQLEVAELKIAVGWGWGDGSASKCLWHKCESLSFIPHPHTTLCTEPPSVGDVGTGGSLVLVDQPG